MKFLNKITAEYRIKFNSCNTENKRMCREKIKLINSKMYLIKLNFEE